MEADSTTFDNSPKQANCATSFPFPVSTGNYEIYSSFISSSGDKTLERQIVEKLQEQGLLPNAVECPTGKPECKMVCKNARVIDRVQWVCSVCGARRGVRVGSLFRRLQCSLAQALGLMLAWSEDADCALAATYFGVKLRVAHGLYNKLDELAAAAHARTRLGGERSVVLLALSRAARREPDTSDQPPAHPILMLADTNHIPTRYWLHVIKDDGKKTHSNSSLDYEFLKSTVEEVVRTVVLPGSLLVASGVPAPPGAVALDQLLNHCDADMHNFLRQRIWRGARALCGCAGDGCARAAQRYLHAALFRAPRDRLLAHALRLVASDTGALPGTE